jgi:hypothetical protein
MQHMINQDRSCGKTHLGNNLVTAKLLIQSLNTTWLNSIQPRSNTFPNPLLHLTAGIVRNPRLDLVSAQKLALEHSD